MALVAFFAAYVLATDETCGWPPRGRAPGLVIAVVVAVAWPPLFARAAIRGRSSLAAVALLAATVSAAGAVWLIYFHPGYAICN